MKNKEGIEIVPVCWNCDTIEGYPTRHIPCKMKRRNKFLWQCPKCGKAVHFIKKKALCQSSQMKWA